MSEKERRRARAAKDAKRKRQKLETLVQALVLIILILLIGIVAVDAPAEELPTGREALAEIAPGNDQSNHLMQMWEEW